MRRFGSVVHEGPAQDVLEHVPVENLHPPAGRFLGTTAALSVAGLSWSLINFGLLLWLPQDMVARGFDVSSASRLLAKSALLALPTVFVAAFLYSRWSTKWTLAGTIAVTAVGVAGVLLLQAHAPTLYLVGSVAVLIVGSNALLAILLPYTAESYPFRIRGRATGWVAGCSKAGGLLAQGLGIVGAAPPLAVAAGLIMGPVLLSLALVGVFGRETRGRDLRDLEPG
jgi:putative MFS transporter